MKRQLSRDLDDPNARPYFLWSEEMTVAQLCETLNGSQGPFLRAVYMGRILREASVAEAWRFLTPQDVVDNWDSIERHLGRRRAFWRFLIRVWGEHGLVKT